MSDPKLVKFNPEILAAFLRRIHPAKTADCVAADSGVAVETVRGWLKGAAKPGCKHLLALIGAYGPELLVAMYPNAPRWLQAAQRAERQRATEDELAALTARLADLMGQDQMKLLGWKRLATIVAAVAARWIAERLIGASRIAVTIAARLETAAEGAGRMANHGRAPWRSGAAPQAWRGPRR